MVVYKNSSGQWFVRFDTVNQGPFSSREKARMWQRGIHADLSDEQLIRETVLGRQSRASYGWDQEPCCS